jgi:hypothetical protein
MTAKSLNLVGMKQVRLTVLKRLDKSHKSEGYYYLCGCYCGNYVEYTTGQLRNKIFPRKSCGKCNDSDKYKKEYSIYTNIHQRCCNPNNSRYESYGGRGIKIAQRWRNDFFFFLEDMGFCPSPTHSIDRIDVNGHYEPNNCRWATPSEQNLNKRKKEYVNYIVNDLC